MSEHAVESDAATDDERRAWARGWDEAHAHFCNGTVPGPSPRRCFHVAHDTRDIPPGRGA